MELTIRNFKHVTDQVIPLADYAIFQGPNGSGKTTILQAFILAVEGHLPGIHDKMLFAELAREGEEVNEMAVGIITAGFSFTRTWSCKEKFDNKLGHRVATVSQEIEITPFVTGEGLTQKKERIKKLFSLNPISVDIENFLGLSDAKRRDFFYKLGEAEKLTVERIRGALESSPIILEKDIEDIWINHLNNFDYFDRQGEPSLDLILIEIGQRLSQQVAAKRQAEGTVQRMIEVKAKRDAIGGHLKDLEAMLRDLLDKRTNLEKDIESNKAKAEVVRLTDEHKNEYLQRVISLEKEISEDAETAADLTGSLKEIDTLVAKSTKKYDQSKKKAEKEIAKADEGIEALRKARGKLLEEHIQGQGEGVSIERSLEKYKPRLSEKSCEFLEGRLKEIDSEGTDENHTLKKVDAQLAAAEEKVDKLNHDFHILLDDQQKIQEEYTAISGKFKQELAVLLDRIPRSEAELAKVKETIKASDALPPPEEVVDVSILQDRLEGIKQSLEDLQPQVNEKRSEMELLIVQVDAESDLKQAEIDLYCLKAMQKALGPAGLKGELVKATLDPIKDRVNTALSLLGYEKEFDFQMIDPRGNECFNFGWKTDTGRLIKFNALSTGEQTVLLTALVAVICSASERDIKFLWMDNVEVISADHEEKYFAGLPDLVKLCGLDHFYVCTSKAFDLSILDPGKEVFPDTWQIYLCPLEE